VIRAHFRAGHAAVGRALQALAARGSIVRRGRRWIVARAESRHGAGGIMLVAPSTDMADFATFGTKVADFCSVLERQCAISATTLHFRSSFHPVDPDPSLIGYIVVAYAQRDVVAANTARLCASGRPVVIADVQGDSPLPNLSGTRQASIVRTQGARSSGRQVALHLRELGHPRIALLSPYNPEHTDWARERLAGVRDVYGADVVAFCSADPRGPAQIWSLVSSSLTETLAPAVQNLATQAHAHAGISDRSWVDVDLPHLLSARYAASQALPLFEQAAADPALTAWVCANDACGASALRYLSGTRIRVPGDVSVAGFDGSREGLVARLASFDFNIPTLADTILRLLLRPEKPSHYKKTPQVDIPGLFLLRETVARL
jgi:hypothetical protein